MAKFSPLMAAPPLVFAGLAALFFIGVNRENPDELPSTRIGKPAPTITLEPLAGNPLLSDAVLREPGIKMVNFWGTWCVACRAEHPTLLWINENLDIPLHGVNFDDETARAVAYLRDEGNPFAALGEDTQSKTKIDWGVYGAPETFIIDGDGTVLMRYAGPITSRVLNETILPFIRKAQTGG